MQLLAPMEAARVKNGSRILWVVYQAFWLSFSRLRLVWFSQGEAASLTIHFAGGTSTFHICEVIVKSDARLNLQFGRRVMRPATSSGSIERAQLDLPSVRQSHSSRPYRSTRPIAHASQVQTRMFCHSEEQLSEIRRSIVHSPLRASMIRRQPKHIYVKSLVQHTGTLARDYSVLKATIGSTRVLRQAGIKAASIVVTARITIVSRIVAASEA
jgi:hypothetical protein